MGTIKYPNKDSHRFSWLRSFAAAEASNQANTAGLLSSSIYEQLVPLADTFQQADRLLTEAKADRTLAAHRLNELVATLQDQITQVWSSVRGRIRWQKEPAALYNYYKLSPSGRSTRPKNRGEWVELAAELLWGDATAVAEGYTSALNAASLQALYDQATAALQELDQADQARQTAYQSLFALRAQADALIRDAVADLRYALRGASAPVREQTMEAYGVEFRNRARNTATARGGLQPPQPSKSATARTLPPPAEPVAPQPHRNGVHAESAPG